MMLTTLHCFTANTRTSSQVDGFEADHFTYATDMDGIGV